MSVDDFFSKAMDHILRAGNRPVQLTLLGRAPSGWKTKKLVATRPDLFVLAQDPDDNLLWSVALHPAALPAAEAAAARAAAAQAAATLAAHQPPQPATSKAATSKGHQKKMQAQPTAAPRGAIALEDANGPEITLAAQIEEEEGSDDLELDLAAPTDSDDSDDEPGTADFGQALASFFAPQSLAARAAAPRTTLYSAFQEAPSGVELGLLGHLRCARNGKQRAEQSQVFINVTDPFCLITVGVQGAGKSHTTACILESCLLPFPPVVNVRQPMAVLVCHYDQSDVNCCEATGLGSASAKLATLLAEHRHAETPPPSLGGSQILVLCSPSFFHQRRKYYAGVCEVRPLLFRWKSLKAQQLKKLMKLDESSTQLYVALMLDMLRDFQRREKVPAYQDFIRQIEELATLPGQSGPLKQRFQMLSSFVYESDKNESLRDVGVDLADVMEAGRMVVVDLTDPMMSPADANGVFQVLLETFRFKQIPRAGKLVAFDEAHRYMGLNGESDGLAREITDCARLMRHEGLRLVISTQSPKAMPEELLELTTVLISHRFQSGDWHQYLAKKVPLPDGSFETIRALQPGEALVYSARPCLPAHEAHAGAAEVVRVQVRRRLTADRGASRVNRESARVAVASSPPTPPGLESPPPPPPAEPAAAPTPAEMPGWAALLDQPPPPPVAVQPSHLPPPSLDPGPSLAHGPGGEPPVPGDRKEAEELVAATALSLADGPASTMPSQTW